MTTIKVVVSDKFNTIEHAFFLDENMLILDLKKILAKTLQCEPANICLASEAGSLDDSTIIKNLNNSRISSSDLLKFTVTAILPSGQAGATASSVALQDLISPSNEDLVSPASLLWANWLRRRSEGPIPLAAQEIGHEGSEGSIIDSPFPAAFTPTISMAPDLINMDLPKELDPLSSKGIATAISMRDFERFVRGSLEYPSLAQSFDFVRLKKTWGLNNNLMLTLDEFQRLMDLFSASETHLLFRAAVRAAFIDSKSSLFGSLNENPIARAQHVAQALLPMASDIFADAVNSSMSGNTKGVWAGFLPEKEAEAALRADGRNGAFLLRLSSDECLGQIIVSYLSAPPQLVPIALADVESIDASVITHHFIQLNISDSDNGYEWFGRAYSSIAEAVASNKSLLKYPCITASLAVRLGSIELGQIAVPHRKAPLWVQCDTLMQAGFGEIDRANFNTAFMYRLYQAINHVRQLTENPSDRKYLNAFPEEAMNRFSTGFLSQLMMLKRYKFDAFHGPIDHSATLARLNGKPPGSFLIRSSLKKIGSVILAFVDSAGIVQQAMISPVYLNNGVLYAGRVTCSGNEFLSLKALLIAYSPPFNNLLNKEIEPYPQSSDIARAVRWHELPLNQFPAVLVSAMSVSHGEDPAPIVPPSDTVLRNVSLLTGSSAMSVSNGEDPAPIVPPADTALRNVSLLTSSSTIVFGDLRRVVWDSLFRERMVPVVVMASESCFMNSGRAVVPGLGGAGNGADLIRTPTVRSLIRTPTVRSLVSHNSDQVFGRPQNSFSDDEIRTGLTCHLSTLGTDESRAASYSNRLGGLFPSYDSLPNQTGIPATIAQERRGYACHSSGVMGLSGMTTTTTSSSSSSSWFMNSGAAAVVPDLGGAGNGADLIRTPRVPSIFSVQGGPSLFSSNRRSSSTAVSFLNPLEHPHLSVGGLSLPPLPIERDPNPSLSEATCDFGSSDNSRKKPRS